jgi:hypothetical protein
VRAGRLGFGRVRSVCRSCIDSLTGRGAEELWKQKSLLVKHSRRLWDLPQKSIFKLSLRPFEGSRAVIHVTRNISCYV